MHPTTLYQNGVLKEQRTASANGIQLSNISASSNYAQAYINHSVGNPFCAAGAITYNAWARFYRSGTSEVSGSRFPVPAHEVYGGWDDGNGNKIWRPLARLSNEGFTCPDRALRLQTGLRFCDILIPMNNETVDPRYTVLGMFGGAGVGLLTGALFFALLLPPPTNVFKIVSTYTLIGLGPLAAGTLIVGLIVLRIIKRRHTHPFTTALIVFALSLGLAIVVAAIATAFGINFFLALIGFGVPVIWCMTVAAILLSWLSRHRTASIASLSCLTAVSVAGLFTLG